MKKAMLLLAIFLFVPFAYASNGCNLEDPICTSNLVNNCDVREDISFKPNQAFVLTSGIDVCMDNLDLDFNGASITSGLEEGYSGINAVESRDNNNVTIRNLATDRVAIGVYLLGGSGGADNINASNGEIAVALDAMDTCKLSNSLSVNNYDYGFAVYCHNNSEISNNIAINSTNAGFDISAHKSLIYGNEVYDTNEEGAGMRIYHTEYAEIKDNIIHRNPFGFWMYESNYNVISGNNFKDNLFESAHEFDNSKVNDWNDSGRGNTWDDLLLSQRQESVSRSSLAALTIPSSLVYEIPGEYDGVDLKPSSTYNIVPYTKVGEVIDIMTLLQEDPKVTRALEKIQGLENSNSWKSDNKLVNEDRIRDIAKAISILKRSGEDDLSTDLLDVLKVFALDKIDNSQNLARLYLANDDKANRYLDRANDHLLRAEEQIEKGNYGNAARQYIKAIQKAERVERVV